MVFTMGLRLRLSPSQTSGADKSRCDLAGDLASGERGRALRGPRNRVAGRATSLASERLPRRSREEVGSLEWGTVRSVISPAHAPVNPNRKNEAQEQMVCGHSQKIQEESEQRQQDPERTPVAPYAPVLSESLPLHASRSFVAAVNMILSTERPPAKRARCADTPYPAGWRRRAVGHQPILPAGWCPSTGRGAPPVGLGARSTPQRGSEQFVCPE